MKAGRVWYAGGQKGGELKLSEEEGVVSSGLLMNRAEAGPLPFAL